MKKLAHFTVFAICLALPLAIGCSGGGGNTVIEAPPAASGEEEAAMEGMSDEEYNAAMEADMAGE